jgi:O-succinylbenzoic acid--CoA ligase
MENKLINYLQQDLEPDWLIGYSNQQIEQRIQKLWVSLPQSISSTKAPFKILLVKDDPLEFIAGFLAAIAINAYLFLGNPNWEQDEWQQVFDLVQPDLIWGEEKIKSKFNKGKAHGDETSPCLDFKIQNSKSTNYLSLKNKLNSQSLIMIPTGGSSGQIRFTIHTWSSLTASVKGFCHYFDQEKVNSYCILPLYHVSGLMQFLRSFLTGGKLAILSYQKIKEGKQLAINPEEFFLSLVPTQLQFLCQSNSKWLSNFKTILLGGAPPWESLLEKARQSCLRLALTYGMTETASQIVTLKPEDFLGGNNSSGKVLPHGKVTIRNEKGDIINNQQIGAIALEADSLCLGYYPHLFANSTFLTDDLGFFDEEGHLHIVGRSTQKIITGGENVFPAEVEAAILATNLVKDVAVIGLSDSYWGQVVTAVYVPIREDITSDFIKNKLQNKISKYKQPKFWLSINQLPRDERGKINYQNLEKLAAKLLLK